MTTITPVTQAHVTVYSGPVATGKTQMLADRAAQIIAAGEDPSKVIVMVAVGSAIPQMRARIERSAGQIAGEAAQKAARAITVLTPQALALRILDCERAYEVTGRRAHVLADFEESFLIQDMLVSGKQPRRLREMMKFLERGWSEIRDVEEGWLINEEEHNLQAYAQRRLDLVEALHPCEVAARCVRYLLEDPAALAEAGVAHVLVDDAGSMGRASQVLACALASEELVLAWDPNGSLKGQDQHPYASGLDEIVAANEGVEVIELATMHGSDAVFGAVRNVLGQPCLGDERASGRRDATLDAPEAASTRQGGVVLPVATQGEGTGSVRVLESQTLDEEMPRLVADVSTAVSRGISEDEIYVAVPSDAWGRRVEAALGQGGLGTTCLCSRQALGCDIRVLGRSADARMYVALQLVVDPGSCVAWRSWCGFGDPMARSGAIAVLLDRCDASGRGLAAELADAAGMQGACPQGLEGLVAAYRQGSEMIEACQGLAGRDLLERLATVVAGDAQVPAGFAALLGDVAEDEGASEMLERVERGLHEPAFAEHGIHVGPLDACLGQTCRVLYLAGAVNGLLPARAAFELTEATVDEQVRIRARLARQLCGACGISRGDIVCSTFTHAEIAQSETLKLHSTFVRLVGGQRVCDLSPSLAIAFIQGREA